MGIERIINLPYPEDLKTCSKIEKYLLRLRHSLIGLSGSLPEIIHTTIIDTGSIYLLIDGTRAMTGSLNMGSKSIIAVDNITVADESWIGIGAALERIIFDTAGDISVMGAKFGIGTSEPATELEVVGDITIGDENWIGIGVAAERIVFDSGGNISIMGANVGIGIDPPAFKNDVYGDINLTGYVYIDSAAWIQNPATRNSFIGEGVMETPGAVGVDEYFYLAYVIDDEIRKYWADGLVYEDAVGTGGTGDGEFSNAHDVCSDATHFYTIETVNDRVQKFLCSDLSYVVKLGSGGSGNGQYANAQGICTDNTYLYVADTSNHRIQKLNCSDLAYVAQIGSFGSGDDQFNSPERICTDGTYVYVSDGGNHRIKKHNCSDLAYVAKIGSQGSGDDQFTSPHGIGTDDTYVYVVDNNDRVKKHNCSDLAYVSKIGSTGSGDDQFSNPKGITTDNTGTYLFISDDSNDRIVKRRCSDLGYIDEVSVAATGSYGLGFSPEVDSDFADNTITGYDACNVLSTGDRNSIYGSSAGKGLLGGKDNVFIGYQAGDTATSAKQCIVIGSTADISATIQNSIAIGYGASVSASHKISLGNTDITALEFPWMTTAGMLINNGSGAITSLTDPGADRIAFWDDTATAVAWLTVSTGLAISTTNLALSHLGIEALTNPGADRIFFWDNSETASEWLTVSTGLQITTTNLTTKDSEIDHGSLAGLTDDDHTHYSLRNKGIMSGCVVSDATVLDVDWDSGYIYDYDNTEVRTISSASSQAVSNNSVNYVYFDPGSSTTVLQMSTTRPTDSDQVLVATVCAQDNDIVGILNEDILAKRGAIHELAIHEMFPAWVISGGSISAYTDDATSDLDVIMDAIVYIAGGHKRGTSVAINSEDTAMITHFHDAANNWDSGTANDLDTANYDIIDDSSGIVNIPSSKWVKGMFYFSLDAINYIYPTTYFTTEAQALAAPLPATPPGLGRCIPLTAIVFQEGETDVSDATYLDIRPGFGETVQTAVSDHGTLSGLSHDDHIQYILHSLATATSDFLVASGSGVYIKKTLAETGEILEADINHDNLVDFASTEHYIVEDENNIIAGEVFS